MNGYYFFVYYFFLKLFLIFDRRDTVKRFVFFI